MGSLLRLAVVLAALFLLLCLLVRLLEDRVVYMPVGGTPLPPPSLGIEEVTFASADGTRLHAWYAAAPEGRPTVLWCHGNAGHLGNRLENLAMLRTRGLGVFLFDYRGYGRSDGKPDEEGIYQDAVAAYDAVSARLVAARDVPAAGAIPIAVLGRSLGAGVAVELSLRRPVVGLVLEGSFPSAPRLGRTIYPFLPLGTLMRNRFDTASRIGRVRCPILFVHGDADDIVPIEMGREVYDLAPEPKRFLTIPGADHNDVPWIGGAPYLDAFAAFVEACVAGTDPFPRPVTTERSPK